MNQQIEFWPKPAEATPRQVKNVVVAAYVLYVLASMALLSGDFGSTLVMAGLGFMAHKAIVPLVKWYLTG